MTVFRVLAFQSVSQWQKIWALCVFAGKKISCSVKHLTSLFYCEVYQWWKTQHLVREDREVLFSKAYSDLNFTRPLKILLQSSLGFEICVLWLQSFSEVCMMNQRLKVDDIWKSLSVEKLASEKIYTSGKISNIWTYKLFMSLIFCVFVWFLHFFTGTILHFCCNYCILLQTGILSFLPEWGAPGREKHHYWLWKQCFTTIWIVKCTGYRQEGNI